MELATCHYHRPFPALRYTLPSAAKGLCSACTSALSVAIRAAEACQVGASMALQLLRSAAVRHVMASCHTLAGCLPVRAVSASCHALAVRASDTTLATDACLATLALMHAPVNNFRRCAAVGACTGGSCGCLPRWWQSHASLRAPRPRSSRRPSSWTAQSRWRTRSWISRLSRSSFSTRSRWTARQVGHWSFARALHELLYCFELTATG